jgi:paired small multidrug resistance pump
MLLSFGFLSLAMQALPMGTSYAVWTGIGTIGGTLVGMVFYKESHDWKRILFISMILIAAIGLKLTA